jgi:hypothetical protein
MNDDRNAPATKGDLAELEARLIEVIRDTQTETLKAFYGFVESVQTRFKAQDDTEAGLKRRLTIVEERLLEVEKKLLMPPAA